MAKLLAIKNRPSAMILRVLENCPHMPAARQRRLSLLMGKNQDSSLSAKESAELEAMLDEVDRKSFWMLARVLVQHRAGRGLAMSK
jgi:hypothetical protein